MLSVRRSGPALNLMASMRTLILALGAGCALIALLVWLHSRISYRVGREFFRVFLFNLTLRKIALSDITRVSTRARGPAERWTNTFWPSHRQLVIHHKGSRRPLVVTPANRYVVKAELQQVIGTTDGDDDTSFQERDDEEGSASEPSRDAERPQAP